MFTKVFIFLGPVGSGKSHQAELLAKKESMTWISTGNILRNSTEQWVKDKLETGQLFEDKDVSAVLKAELDRVSMENTAGLVLDGYPRRVSQATWLEGVLAEFDSSVTQALHIVVGEEEAKKRMIARGRADDVADAIDQRNKEYTENVLPVVEYYKDKGALIEVDGVGTIEEVEARVRSVLGFES